MSLTWNEELRTKAQVGTRYGVVYEARSRCWFAWDKHEHRTVGEGYAERYPASKNAALRYAGKLNWQEMVEEAGDGRGTE